MNVSSLSYLNQPTSAAATSSEEQNETSKVQFLELLATQLQYQDPLNPMENSEFLGQMAQFSTLEQLMEIRAALERMETAGQQIDDSSSPAV